MSNAEAGQIRMFVGELHKGEVWTDVLGWSDERVCIGGDGFGMFNTPGVSVAVYVNEKADGRDRFGKFDDQIYKDDKAALALDESERKGKEEAERKAKEEEKNKKEEAAEGNAAKTNGVTMSGNHP